MNIITRELRLYKRSGVWFTGIVTPFILVICLGIAITGTTHNVPVGLVSGDSILTEQLSQVFINETSFVIHYIKESDINNLLVSGNLRAVIQVDSVVSNKVNITIYIDSTDTAIKEQVQYSLTSIIYQNLGIKGYVVSISTQELFSGKSFFTYLIPSILVVGPVMAGLFGASDTIINEKEDKTLENVIVSGFSPFKFAVQKIISFFLTTAMTLVLTFIIVVILSGTIPNISAILIMFLLIFVSSFIFISLGFVISTYLPNKEVAGALGGTVMFPILFISGVFLSVYSMIDFMVPFAQMNPLTLCMEALRTILLKNGTFDNVFQSFIILLAFSVILLSIAVYRMNKIINTMQK